MLVEEEGFRSKIGSVFRSSKRQDGKVEDEGFLYFSFSKIEEGSFFLFRIQKEMFLNSKKYPPIFEGSAARHGSDLWVVIRSLQAQKSKSECLILLERIPKIEDGGLFVLRDRSRSKKEDLSIFEIKIEDRGSFEDANKL